MTLVDLIDNPSTVPPQGWDTTWESETEPEWRFGAPAPSTLLPCGCHLRRPDYEAVLCTQDLAELNSREKEIREPATEHGAAD